MKLIKLKLCAVVLILSGFIVLHAQKLYVLDKSDTQTEYSISGIRSLTFPTGSITVLENNGNTDTYSVSDLRYLSFVDLTTSEPGPGLICSNPILSLIIFLLLLLLLTLMSVVFFRNKKRKSLGNGFISIVMLFFLSSIAHGQNDKMYIMDQGKIVSSYNLTQVDSVIFYLPDNIVADVDGNFYTSVQIGIQIWMVENLKTTKYNDGTPIPNVTDNTIWEGLNTPAYCWYENCRSAYGDIYGALYNWHTVNTGNLCPTGWHVPSNSEWITLEDYLIANGYNFDGSTSLNKIAKALASDELWVSSTVTGTVGNTDYPEKRNVTGFTALPAGTRYDYYNGFGVVGERAYWWSSTEQNSIGVMVAYGRWMRYNGNGLNKYGYEKHYGFSVRCIKD